MKISNKQFYNEKCNDILPIRSKIYCKRAEIYCGIISFVKTGFKRNIETILKNRIGIEKTDIMLAVYAVKQ